MGDPHFFATSQALHSWKKKTIPALSQMSLQIGPVVTPIDLLGLQFQ
jgi:hypothetical protein